MEVGTRTARLWIEAAGLAATASSTAAANVRRRRRGAALLGLALGSSSAAAATHALVSAWVYRAGNTSAKHPTWCHESSPERSMPAVSDEHRGQRAICREESAERSPVSAQLVGVIQEIVPCLNPACPRRVARVVESVEQLH
ncbi:hypothetical protein ACP4OV_031779 [Aristida adscensionis]